MAHFLAAVHNASNCQSSDIVSYHCNEAIKADMAIRNVGIAFALSQAIEF